MADDTAIRINWEPPGPVAGAYMSTAPIVGGMQLLNGPIGSGKTTTCLVKALTLAQAQRPSTTVRARDDRGRLVPVRKFRIGVVRDTYRNLWKTTLPSWFTRIPRAAGSFTGAENAPASHAVTMQLADGSVVDFRADFIAIGDNAVEEVMRGYEVTAWYLNELDLLSKEVYAFALGRAGRFPLMTEGGPSWYGILADCNAPEFESWLCQPSTAEPDAVDGFFLADPARLKKLGIEIFRQPGGRDARAENLKNLVPGYYENQVRGQATWYVARMIDNKPGFSRAGKPVHADFNDAVHVPGEEIAPMVGVPLVIGLDPRTNPSAAFMQRTPEGRRFFVDELQAEQNTGPRRFGEMIAQLLHDRFPFLRPEMIRGMCDPSAQYGADRAAGEQDWLEIVGAVAGIRIEAAPTNNLDIRREALGKPLRESVDGQPKIQVSPRCRVLRAGLNSGFRFRKLNVPGAERYGDEVEKGPYADLCEAAEYACLSDGAELDIRERRAWQRGATAQRQAQDDWQPFGAA